jgi:UDP-GlcNAc:undecaprenyl-phosphate GlcNAc-1-phosphate transferase
VTPYLLVLVSAAVVTFLATAVVRRLSIKIGAIDQPSDRKVHPKATPTGGGLAIVLGVLAGLALSRGLDPLSELWRAGSDIEAAALGTVVILVVGFFDDLKGTTALAKLAGQVLAVGIVVLLGVQLFYFYVPGSGVLVLDPSLGVPLTVLWVVGMVNAVNLIDGLDGLAAGMVAIAALAFFAYMHRAPGVEGQPNSAALLSIATAGACLGFLPWNFNPARIFMGDSGSLPLGLLLGVATISGVGRNAYPPPGGDFAVVAIPIAVPLLVLAIPFLDVLLAILRRVRKGTGIAHADKEHIHHRLLDIGHSHRQAVLLMYLWSALISGTALAVAFIDGRLLVGAIALVSVIIFAATMLPRLVAGKRRAGHRGSPVEVPGDAPAGTGSGSGSGGGGEGPITLAKEHSA